MKAAEVAPLILNRRTALERHMLSCRSCDIEWPCDVALRIIARQSRVAA